MSITEEENKVTDRNGVHLERSITRQSTTHLLDDKLAQENPSLIARILSSIHRQRAFLFSNLVIVMVWSCVCAWGAERLQEEAESEPGGRAERWLQWLEGAGRQFRLIGTLFVFAVVFRFNRCYDRWNQGRIIWGNIVTVSLDITRMASNWIVEEEYADRFCRFVVVFAYASKALLRGHTLGDPDEEGQGLFERGFLTREELDDMESYEGWQPQYCLDMMDVIWIEAHYPEKALMFDASHKVHSQLFRAIDGDITKLGAAIGDAIRVRASGLPETYDGLHHLMFYFYFTLASVFFAPTVGWVLPILICLESILILSIIIMGSDLVQPFGTDKVDLPLELFCEIIEVQTKQIRERSKRQIFKKLARTSNGRPIKSMKPSSASVSRGIKDDHKKVSMEKAAQQKKKSSAPPPPPACQPAI